MMTSTVTITPRASGHEDRVPRGLEARGVSAEDETYRERSDAQRAKQPGLEYVRLESRPAEPWAVMDSTVAQAAILSDFAGLSSERIDQ